MGTMDRITTAVQEGHMTLLEGVAQIAAGLNRNGPEGSFKLGWPLISSIEAAGEHFVRQGYEALTPQQIAEVLRRFDYETETDIDAHLKGDQ